MKKICLIPLLLLLTQQAFSMTCREAVVAVYKDYGIDKDPRSFSSYSFEELGFTVEEYNSLPQSYQQVAYILIKPMKMTVEETLDIINRRLALFSGTFYENIIENDLNPANDVPEERRVQAQELKDKIENWKNLKTMLETCDYEE